MVATTEVTPGAVLLLAPLWQEGMVEEEVGLIKIGEAEAARVVPGIGLIRTAAILGKESL